MEVEKRSSKGGFLQLFDWNLKSRKKLFSNKSELSENLNKGKENVDGAAISRLQQIHEYGRGHYHGASSLSGDERYEAEAPGVVARLMGLDSLPTKTVSKPFNGPSFESESFRDSFYITGTKDYQNEHHIVMYESMRNKLDGLARNPLELRLQKLQNRPIERFQTEVLPHKSAKPMSVGNNRMLSPIKSPGFIPPKNAAYVMEAAARIIEQSPRSTFKGKSPMRIQDLKEKLEVAQKSSKIPEVSSKSKNVERQPREKGDRHLFRDSEASKVGPQSMKSKEKSASLAVQAKSNVQKRDVISPGGRRVNQKQNVEIKPSSSSSNQPDTKKCIEKRSSSSKSSNVLKQNNQKQNCTSSKDRASSKKPSASHRSERKVVSKSDTTRLNKIVNKIVVDTSVVSGKTNSLENDSKRGFSESRIKNVSGKRRSVSVDDYSERSTAENARTSKDERTIKCNIAIEGHTKWDSIDKTSGTDVVSFSFSSPIKKSLPRSNSAQAIEKKKNTSVITCSGDNSKYSTGSSLGFNVVDGDALSVLLELKLKEITSRVDFSHQDFKEVQSMSKSSNSFQDSVSTLNSLNTIDVHTKGLKFEIPKDNSNIGCNSHCSSYDEFELRPTLNWERRGEMGEHSNCSNGEYGRDFDLRHLSPASSLEPSLSEASCNSFDSSEDSKWCTTSEADEVSDWNSTRTQHLEDGDLDLSDSACSTSVGAMRGNTTTISIYTDFTGLYHWELEYIRDIINNADLTLDEFACGQVHQIIEPILYDQFEIQITESHKNLEEPFKIARKALFDCVEECLELKSKCIFSGSFRAWTKGTGVCQSTNRLAEDLYRVIVGWTNMADLMVDEVVDKDMSSQLGKWVDFETEIFEEGVDMEKEILSSLVDELVYDLLF